MCQQQVSEAVEGRLTLRECDEAKVSHFGGMKAARVSKNAMKKAVITEID